MAIKPLDNTSWNDYPPQMHQHDQPLQAIYGAHGARGGGMANGNKSNSKMKITVHKGELIKTPMQSVGSLFESKVHLTSLPPLARLPKRSP